MRKLSEAAEYARLIDRVSDPLSVEEEQVVVRSLAEGDEGAKEVLIESNLRYALKKAIKFHRNLPVIPLLDLIQEANSGLVIAADKYDPTSGVRFLTFATKIINQRLWSAKERYSMIRIPGHVVSRLKRSKAGIIKMTRVMKEADHLSRELDTFSGIHIDIDHVKINIPEVDSEGPTPGGDRFEMLLRLIDSLQPRRSQVLRMRYGIGGTGPMTVREIADELGISVKCAENTLHRAVRDCRLAAKNPERHRAAVSRGRSVMAARTRHDRDEIANYSLDLLPERWGHCIRMYYGLDEAPPRTIKSIADELGVTKERIKQILRNAKDRLRNGSKPTEREREKERIRRESRRRRRRVR